jgi:hypothetical protein
LVGVGGWFGGLVGSGFGGGDRDGLGCGRCGFLVGGAGLGEIGGAWASARVGSFSLSERRRAVGEVLEVMVEVVSRRRKEGKKAEGLREVGGTDERVRRFFDI